MQPLDYETVPLYSVVVMATDFPENPNDRLNSTTTLTIRVLDVDDQDPVFENAETRQNCSSSEDATFDCIPAYHSSVTEGQIAGVLDMYPGRIHAKDPDTLGASVTYSLKSGTPNFEEFFEIDTRTATVKQIKNVDRSLNKNFDLVIEAMENTPRKGRAFARLEIKVLKIDSSPPKLVIPSYTGKVKEASAPGTPVLRDDGSEEPFVLSVYDPDIEEGEAPPDYIFELTTSAFEVDDHGTLIVKEANLDRDPPNLSEHTFQAIARENREGGSASAPVTLTVHLLDINDNPPRLPNIPAVTVPAGSNHRNVAEVKAIDADEGENAIVTYSLLSGGREKFTINPQTGMIQAVGPLEAGEDFFLNIQVTDKGNLSSEGFIEIVVSRGPNTNGPVFSRSRYSAIVSEDIPHGEEILTVKARDPEDAVSYYSIVGGNGGNAFEIDTLTGRITVVAPLDREQQSEHTLIIQAEDSEGKSNTASVVIQVTDVNDVTPKFINEPYSFRVDEGLKDVSVGTVKAEDQDLGVFGKVVYLLEGGTSNFRIEPKSGEIFTSKSLDYEKDQVHYLSVVAHDMADDPRSATTTVTVLVNDISDEDPFFPKDTYKVQVSENTAIGTVITTVKAIDKDTVPTITYKLIEGDSKLFKVSSDSGRVTVAGNLDYEEKSNHSIIIGTFASNKVVDKATTIVNIEIEDLNDEVPVLESLHTVTLDKEAPIGTVITSISATDKDGTSPNNKVMFEVLENNEPSTLFKIDENGEIRLNSPLYDSALTKLNVEVVATDGGDPPLSTSGEFQILLLEGTIGTFSEISEGDSSSSGLNGKLSVSALSPRFSKDYSNLTVNENIPIGSVVVKIPLVNATASSVMCTIISGNENETFKTKVTREGNCKILSSQILDYEAKGQYNLSIALHPEGFAVSNGQQKPVLSEAFVQINIRDINDNSPQFLLEGLDVLEEDSQISVLSYALQSSPIKTKIVDLKANDADSGMRGTIEYKLLPESNRGNYFEVDSKTGRVFVKRSLYNVPLELLPFNLSLTATDKTGINGTQHVTKLNLIVPIIEEIHRSVLLIDIRKKEVKNELENIKGQISKITGKFAQIEDVKNDRKLPTSETQLWFHLLDPKTHLPVYPENLYEPKTNKEFLMSISRELKNARAMHLFSPSQLLQTSVEMKKESTNVLQSEKEDGVIRVDAGYNLTTLEYVLMALAAFIILFVLCAIIAVCILWSKFSKKWNTADKTVMLIPPIIERPASASILESVSKEYEVQVLHMSVPLDDDSVQEVPVESESNRQAYLDNVSYISKSRNGLEGSSSSGGSSGLATPSNFVVDQNGVAPSFPAWSPDLTLGGNHFSSTHLDNEPNGFSASATNENVMFGRRGFGETSPVETTTEL
ncbi:Protocadherin-15 [Armadillidium vulgare]|nr:Protocadherin-15 [Armadillidium vulgare]